MKTKEGLFRIGRTTTYYDMAEIKAESAEVALGIARTLDQQGYDPFDLGQMSETEYVILDQ